MQIHRIIATILIALTLSACSVLTAPLSSSLKPGEQVPADKVLVIGKFVLDPDVEQGSLAGMAAGRGTLRGVIKLMLSKDLSQKVNADAMVPFSVEEIIDVKYPGMSFLPMTAGTRYVRLGQYATSASGRFVKSGGGTMRVANVNQINLFSDIKFAIPVNAKAVYIGTVVYRHDGYNATAVSVRDEYASALQELAALKLNNIQSKDVVKSLATVVGKPLQRKH